MQIVSKRAADPENWGNPVS